MTTPETRTPQERVVGITELVENILSYLPLKDLLTCREVSKKVKTDIDGSLPLRETMFLHPTRAAKEAWRLDPEIDGSGKGITSVRPVAGMIPFLGNATGHLTALHPTPHMIRTPVVLNPIFPNERERRISELYESRDECDHLCTSDIVHRIGTGDRMTPKPPRKKNKRWSYTNWEPRKYKKQEPRSYLPPELLHNATLVEVLQSLDIGDAPSADEVQAGVECWLLDTIVATDEMWLECRRTRRMPLSRSDRYDRAGL